MKANPQIDSQTVQFMLHQVLHGGTFCAAALAKIRGSSMIRCSWIAAQVRSKHEFRVAAALREKGYETFLPIYRSVREWSDRKKTAELPLIPGYVFIRAASTDSHGPICTTSGVVKMLGYGRQPAMIEDAEIKRIKTVSDSSLKTEPWVYLNHGTQVKIAQGALAGISGKVIQDKGSTLLILSVEMMQRSVAVHIDRSWIDASAATVASHENRPGVAGKS